MGVRLAFLLSDMLWLTMDCVGAVYGWSFIVLITRAQFNSTVADQCTSVVERCDMWAVLTYCSEYRLFQQNKIVGNQVVD